jgi:hypothetical protein
MTRGTLARRADRIRPRTRLVRNAAAYSLLREYVREYVQYTDQSVNQALVRASSSAFARDQLARFLCAIAGLLRID